MANTITIIADSGYEVVYYPDSHRLKINGDWCKSVTSINETAAKGVFFDNWLKNHSKEEIYSILEKANTIGNLCHDNMPMLLQGKVPDINVKTEWIKECQQAFNNIMDWIKNNKVEPIATEQVVGSLQHKYGGKYDAKIMINGKKVITDWKTSKHIYWTHILQNVAYKKAHEEMYPKEIIEECRVIRFDKFSYAIEDLLIPNEMQDIAFKCFLRLKETAYDKSFFERYIKYKKEI